MDNLFGSNVSKEKVNKIARKVKMELILATGKKRYSEVAKKIRKMFKKKDERELALIILGYEMGFEDAKKKILEGMKETLKDLLKNFKGGD